MPHPTSSAQPSLPSLEASLDSSQDTWQVWSQEHSHRVRREDAGFRKTGIVAPILGRGVCVQRYNLGSHEEWTVVQGNLEMGMVAFLIRNPGLELSQGRSLGLGLPEAVTSQALGILSLLEVLGLGHPDSDLRYRPST